MCVWPCWGSAGCVTVTRSGCLCTQTQPYPLALTWMGKRLPGGATASAVRPISVAEAKFFSKCLVVKSASFSGMILNVTAAVTGHEEIEKGIFTTPPLLLSEYFAFSCTLLVFGHMTTWFSYSWNHCRNSILNFYFMKLWRLFILHVKKNL